MNQSHDVIGHSLFDANVPHLFLHRDDFRAGDDWPKVVEGVVVLLDEEDVDFALRIGIAKRDSDAEAVELGFGQGISAVIFAGVLRGNDEERARQIASFAEALAWLERTGMDVEKALPVMTNGAPGSPQVKAMAQRMTSRDYTPNFLLKLLAKDLNYAMKESKSHLDKLTTASTAIELLNNAIAQGLGEKDMSAVAEPLRTRSK